LPSVAPVIDVAREVSPVVQPKTDARVRRQVAHDRPLLRSQQYCIGMIRTIAPSGSTGSIHFGDKTRPIRYAYI
jgi:hypothetical protein